MAQTKKQQQQNQKGGGQQQNQKGGGQQQGTENKKPFVHKPGSGSLFKNTRKEAENHPDMTGSFVDLDGNECWLSAWKHDGNKGAYLSISAQLKEQNQNSSGGGNQKSDDIF